MFVSFNGNVFSPENAVQQSFVYTFTKKRSIVLFVIFFLYCNVDLFSMLHESGFLTKYSSVRYSERKTSEISCLGVGKCPHFLNSESP